MPRPHNLFTAVLPCGTAALVLIADGVPLDQLYTTLDAEEGVDRAFRKLDSIKVQVI